MRLSSLKHLASILIYFASGCVLAAPETELAKHISTIIEAEPLTRAAPKYPPSSARKGQEGWVKVSFVVTDGGKVADPVVMDSSGLKAFEKAALRAVKRWQYNPAIQDGKPIQQCKNFVQLDFVLNGRVGVTRKFLGRYRQVTEAVNNNELPLAQTLLAQMADEQQWNLTESTLFWLADSYYAKATNDPERELKSIRRAITIDNESISKPIKQYLLEREFVLSIDQQEFQYALKAFKKLDSLLDGDKNKLTKFTPYFDQVSELVTGTDPLIREAHLDTDGQLFHTLSRNAFALYVGEGKLDEVQIRCDNKLSRFSAADKSEWRIPASWGQCSLYVTGDPAANFQVVEIGDFVGEI